MTSRAEAGCRRFDRYLDTQFRNCGAEMPEEFRRHLELCQRCAALYRWACRERAGEQPPPEFEDALSARLCASLTPVKPLPSGHILALRFIVIFGLLLVFLAGLMGSSGVKYMTEAQFFSLVMILGTAAVLLAVSLSWQMVPGGGQRIPAPLLIGVFVAGFTLMVALQFPWEQTGEIFGHGWECAAVGLMMALPAGAILLLFAARGTPLSYRTVGATLGAVSGLLALTALQLSCHNQHAGHILVWHGGVVVVCICTGYLLGRIGERLAIGRGSRHT